MEVEEATGGEILIVMKHVCKLCSRRFPCGRSLGGHMKSHLITNPSDHQTVDQEKVNNTRDMKKEKTWRADHQSHSCKQCGKTFQSSKALSGHMKSHAVERKKEKEREREKAKENSNAASSSTSEIDQQEQEDVAIGLIMLSRDLGSYLETQKRKMKADFEGIEKRSKFGCTTCNKVFQTYQALGGHRASHKKGNGCSPLKLEGTKIGEGGRVVSSSDVNEESASKRVIQKHECPICLRVFSSGQALGGHKRSHLMPPTKRDDFLDLNRPAPLEEDLVGFKQWWVDWISN